MYFSTYQDESEQGEQEEAASEAKDNKSGQVSGCEYYVQYHKLIHILHRHVHSHYIQASGKDAAASGAKGNNKGQVEVVRVCVCDVMFVCMLLCARILL